MIAQLDAPYLRARPARLYGRLLSYALFEGRPVTTRGRWINPLVFANLALAAKLPPLREVDRPIFLIGSGRSGTTVLGKVLSLFPRVGFLNEPKALWHAGVGERVGGEDLIGSYDRGPARVRLGAEDASPACRRRMQRLVGAYLVAGGARRLVDKSPELVFRVPFVRALFPDARFLWLVRDGRATAASIARWSRDHGREVRGERHDWWGVQGRKWRLLVDELVPNDPELGPRARELRGLADPVSRARLEWARTARAGREAASAWPEAVRRVSYEELVDDPVATLEALRRFCELPACEVATAYARRVLRPGGTDDAVAGPSEGGGLTRFVGRVFERERAALGFPH